MTGRGTLAAVPKPPRRPDALAGKIFLARKVIETAQLTPRDLRSSAWQPVFRGIYADARLELSHWHRCLAASRYLIPAPGAVAGRSAAAVYGAGTPDAGDPVEVIVPSGLAFGPVRGLQVHHGDVLPDEIRQVDRVRLTSPLRTAWDLAQWVDVVEAVVLLDQLVRRRCVTVPAVVAFAEERSGRRGWRRLQRAAALVDAGAESPQESRLRVRLVLAGLPRPVTQYVVERDGRFVARVDLAWPEQRVAVEYDGLWHAGNDQIHRDRRRLNHLVGADWTVLHVTSRRLSEDFATFVAELRTALTRSR